MRVIVVGATGRVGQHVLVDLADNKFVNKVVSLEEEGAEAQPGGVVDRDIERRTLDLTANLTAQFRFADAVVYAGWPVSDTGEDGTSMRNLAVVENVCKGVASSEVRVFVYGSSVGAYASAPAGHLVDENWPTRGIPNFLSSLRMAECEHLVDRFEEAHPLTRVVRIRPSLIACSVEFEVWRQSLIGRRLIAAAIETRVVPDFTSCALEIIHVADLARAFSLAVTQSVVGSFNVAAGPLTSELVAQRLVARKVPVSLDAALELLTVSSDVGLHSLNPSRVKLALEAPFVDTTRAQTNLGWRIEHSVGLILQELMDSLKMSNARTRTTRRGRSVSTLPFDYVRLYEDALDFFGRQVHAIRQMQWTLSTEHQGLSVLELVTFVGRAQYRTAMLLGGEPEETVESKLPGDPLGFVRADGWDLAAERGKLATEKLRSPASDEEEESDGDRERRRRSLPKVLPDVICDLVLLGISLGRTIGVDNEPGLELMWFVEHHLSGLDAELADALEDVGTASLL
jgi:nucleoside-diphosphate-sugar epimerase